MRERKEIMEDAKRPGWGYSVELMLELLLDIRDKLYEVEISGIETPPPLNNNN